jgi:hypothetical protein
MVSSCRAVEKVWCWTADDEHARKRTLDPVEHVDNSAPADVGALRGGGAAVPVAEAPTRPVAMGPQSPAQVRAVLRYGRASDGKITKRMLKQMPRSVRDVFV